jgi:hypothetical protein
MHNILTVMSTSYSTPICFDLFTVHSGSLFLNMVKLKIKIMNKIKMFTYVIVTDYKEIVVVRNVVK